MSLQYIEGVIMWLDVSVAGRVLLAPSFQGTPAPAFTKLSRPGTSASLEACVARSVISVA